MFETYSLEQWLLFLYIYSFLGWIFESTYVSLKEHKFVNRGFLNGPLLPIYGSGAVMMLAASEPYKNNIILTFIAGMIGATLLELVVGMTLEAIFKVKYWDYSYRKIQYKGYICLVSSLTWGLFTVILNRYLHPGVLYLLSLVPVTAIHVSMAVVSAITMYDIYVSTRDALDLREALLKLEEIRKEAEVLKQCADSYRASIDEDFNQFMKSHPSIEHAEELIHNLGYQLEQLREVIRVTDEEIKVQYEKERLELHTKVDSFEGMKAKCLELHEKHKEKIKNRILNNPTMASKHYKEAFDIMRNNAREHSSKH